MSSERDRQKARDLIEQITTDHGFISSRELKKISDPDLRRKIEDAFLKKDEMLGNQVITVAKNLYSNKTRFIFELLQNADDNNYEKAKCANIAPFVAFHVHPDRIVVECNEDGFTQKNLSAICAIGQSSKTHRQGFIGEKGLGFKSVFMAAWKVHIQSGPFSFSFTHRPGDSGMGMISPEWEDDFDEQMPHPMTRITLHLHQFEDKNRQSRLHATIREELTAIQAEFLLFMKNLAEVHVAGYNDDAICTSRTKYSASRPSFNLAILHKTADTVTGQETKYYHVTTHEASGLARNEDREYSDKDEACCAYSQSTVVLAFPVSDTSVPIIESQKVFVFLPVNEAGFNFIIQADFVTSANRQDILSGDQRNEGLITAVSEAFITAVGQFCKHDTLKYQWMRYLPNKQRKVWGLLWQKLVDRITNRLATAPVLFSRQGNRCHGLRSLYAPCSDVLDRHGDLLFSDGNTAIISKSYDAKDIKLLRGYGLATVPFNLTIDWAGKDLAKGAMSVMKSPTTSEDWHSRVAKLFSSAFDKRLADAMRALQNVRFIPMEDGTWKFASSGPFYFAKSNELNIPTDLVDMSTISRCVTNPQRLTFFKHLGALHASESVVRQKILQRYCPSLKSNAVTLKQSIEHISFLYQTHHLKSSAEAYCDLALYDEQNRRELPEKSIMYIITDDEYGPWELLKGSITAHFVNKAYFNEIPSSVPSLDLKFVEWLHKELRVENCVYFFDWHGELEIHSKHIRTTNPEKFLGALLLWHEQYPAHLEPNCVKTLRETKVLCRGNQYFPLKDAYFPTKELEAKVSRLVEPDAVFPWLHLDPSIPRDPMPSNWHQLLLKLGVNIPLNGLDFALDMLHYTVAKFPTIPSDETRDRLFDLYTHTLSKYLENFASLQAQKKAQKEAQKKIRAFFATTRCIFVPLDGGECRLACLGECAWGAPRRMRTTFALELLYEPFASFCESTKPLWTSVLGIEDCTWEDYVNELRELKNLDRGNTDTDAIETIYQALSSLVTKSSDITADIVHSFERDALVYAGSSDTGTTWYRPSQCVWSTAAWLRGKISLNNHYEDLEGFFVDFLGVKPVDLKMAIDELLKTGSQPQVSVQDIKDSIQMVNSLLAHESAESRCPERIAGEKIFPVKYRDGEVVCACRNVEFFINDRDPLMKSFAGKVKFLDFTLEEVNQLQPFLRWALVEDKYVSKQVKEITSFDGKNATPVLVPNRQIRHKAHALLRIAAHFNSPRTQTTHGAQRFYKILGDTDIFGTDRISSSVVLVQDDESFSVEGKKYTVYITEDAEKAKIYIPQSRDDQDYTFGTILPRKFFEWMMTDPSTQICDALNTHGVEITNYVLSAPRSRLVDTLEEHGIAAISIENHDVDDDAATDTVNTPVSSTSDTLDVVSSSTAMRSALHARQVRTGLGPLSEDFASRDASASLDGIFMPQLSHDDPQYLVLLSHAIAHGHRGSIPSNTHRAPRYSREDGNRITLSPTNQLDRDCRIGAAGELYAFELLLGLQLPGFSRSNWQSNMTRYVTSHPEYANMQEWHGPETSDITYHDATGLLTKLFIEKGYLSSEIWQNQRPQYFIEVKSTTSSCDTMFYMDNSQYKLMQKCARVDETNGDIYVIFRVYYLGRDDVGLEIYVDPERLRSPGRLTFTSEGWIIVANAPL